MTNELYVKRSNASGDTISVTKGIVSRVEPRIYLQSSELLTIQTDAAIDFGNSGGPVVIGNKVAGVVFQGFSSSAYEKIKVSWHYKILN